MRFVFKPTHLYYLISFGCNERCTKCHHWAIRPAPKPLEPELISDAINQMPNVREFCIVGGEPLLFRERISEILFSIEKHPVRTVLITNGVLLTPDFLDRIAHLNLHIVVSIDTLDREKWKFVRGRDTMEVVMGNLNHARSVLRTDQLSLQSVLAAETREDIPAVRALCDEWGIYHSVQDYMTEGFNGEWTTLPSEQKRIPDHEICYSAGRNLSIMPNGDVFTCFQQTWIMGCQKPLGNLKTERIDDILNSSYTESVQEAMRRCNHPCKVLKCNQKQ
ncbi:MAG: radical SAM protein [Candidatus Methylacidiphilales bacterium]|nr:radical SAM protein [Candidatus Methylacidiphilales bacterium]